MKPPNIDIAVLFLVNQREHSTNQSGSVWARKLVRLCCVTHGRAHMPGQEESQFTGIFSQILKVFCEFGF